MPDPINPELDAIIQKMVEANEPDEVIQETIASYKPAEPKTGMQGLWEGVTQAPGRFLTGLKDQVKGVMNLTDAPTHEGFSGKAYDAIRDATPGGRVIESMIGGVPTLVQAAKDYVRLGYHTAVGDEQADPYEFGKQTGNLGTQAVLNYVTGRFAPASVKPVVRVAGAGTRKVAKLGFPLKIAGSHQIAMGNPAGVAMIVAPDALEWAGGKLVRAGTTAGAALKTPAGRLLELQSNVERAGATPHPSAVAQWRSTLDDIQAELSARINVAKLPEDVVALQKEQNKVAQFSARVNKMGKPAKQPKPVDPAKEWSQEARNETARERYIRQQQEQEAKNLNTRDKFTRKVEVDRDLADREAAARAEGGSGSSGGPMSDADLYLAKGGNPIVAEAIRRSQAGQTAAAAPTSAASAPPPSASIQAAMDRMKERSAAPVATETPVAASTAPEATAAARGRLAQEPLDDIARNRSRGAQGPGSERAKFHPNLTRNDFTGIGLNPDLKYTKLRPELKRKMIEFRRRRNEDYLALERALRAIPDDLQ